MKLAQFKTIIKEAVREVVKEELNGKIILSESMIPQKQFVTTVVTPTPERQTAPNSIQALLEETRRGMSGEDFNSVMNLDSSNVNGGYIPNMNNYGTPSAPPTVTSVTSMIQASNNGAVTEEQVQINAVPDFSGIMGRMKEAGQI